MRPRRPSNSASWIFPALAAFALTSTAGPAPAADDKPVVVVDTTAGAITIELDRAKAPISVDNFLKYVDKGFYDGLIFHRVKPDGPGMIQAGGFSESNGALQEKKQGALPPIRNESGNGLSNTRGTIAMARTRAPNSATSQFYINHGDNSGLDNLGGGYAVFGKVIGGLDVVDAIAKSETTVKTTAQGQPFEDVPVKPITIKSARRKGS